MEKVVKIAGKETIDQFLELYIDKIKAIKEMKLLELKSNKEVGEKKESKALAMVTMRQILTLFGDEVALPLADQIIKQVHLLNLDYK